MNGRKTEFPHNSPEQVREYIEQALALVAELAPPDDLRGLVFDKAVNLYSAKSVGVEMIQPGIGGLAIPGAGL